MRARIENQVLYLNKDDVPTYQKQGSVVRNTYFWALKAIAGYARRDQDWEFEEEIWLALQRVLLSFSESGYLPLRETILEFPSYDVEIPPVLRSVATRE